jgi:hypothetical protein
MIASEDRHAFPPLAADFPSLAVIAPVAVCPLSSWFTCPLWLRKRGKLKTVAGEWALAKVFFQPADLPHQGPRTATFDHFLIVPLILSIAKQKILRM